METRYPWNGRVALHVDPEREQKMAIHIRIPGWLTGEPALGGLYSFTDMRELSLSISVNGRAVSCSMEKGYAVIDRVWKKGDLLAWDFPMETRRIVAKPDVVEDRGKVALQRGPLVYCVEGADNSGGVWNLVLPSDAAFAEKPRRILSENIVAVEIDALSAEPSSDGRSVTMAKRRVTAIPYYVWNNRGAAPMQVWLPTVIKQVKIE
jgi:DUF1680 family protein